MDARLSGLALLHDASEAGVSQTARNLDMGLAYRYEHRDAFTRRNCILIILTI